MEEVSLNHLPRHGEHGPCLGDGTTLLPARMVPVKRPQRRGARVLGGEVSSLERNKMVVQRVVDEIINSWRPDKIDDFFNPEACERARRDFTSFHSAFPDWRMETLDLVAEGETVVARFKCRGTHRDRWMGRQPSGKRMEVDEVFFFHFRDGKIDGVWGIEDTKTRMDQLGM
jgi:predicted ester cyclase